MFHRVRNRVRMLSAVRSAVDVPLQASAFWVDVTACSASERLWERAEAAQVEQVQTWLAQALPANAVAAGPFGQSIRFLIKHQA